MPLTLRLLAGRRSPFGLRGLKYPAPHGPACPAGSQPSWAAWIEIVYIADMRFLTEESQPSWAAWIEIGEKNVSILFPFGRSPLGLRGLKLT